MKVLLVESHYRTRSWFAAIKSLDELFILSVLPEEKKLFVDGGVLNNKILDLHNPCLAKIEFNKAVKYLTEIEDKMSFSFNKIVRMDRTMRLNNYEYIVKYYYYITKNIITFIEKMNIEIVIMEPTWSHEIILCNICEYMKIPVFAPVKDKILPNRFFMFQGYLRDKPFLRGENKINQDVTDKVIALVKRGEKPQYFDKFSNRNRLNFNKFKVLYEITRLTVFGLMNKNIQPKLHLSIIKKVAAIYRVQFFTYFNKFSKLSDLELPYILITLHVQPEAGIDVVGSSFSNQLQFVRQIARTTPAGYYVLVKEHPHDFGRRNAYFYNELYKLPNVRVLGPHENSFDAIKEARLVISTAGTSSFEAALMGIPAITAVNMYFQDLMVMDSFDPNVDQISDVLLKAKKWKESFDNEKTIKILNNMQTNVFVGNPGDCMIDPNVLSKENIRNLRDSFSEVINSIQA